MAVFSSNILYKQAFQTNSDLYLSFVTPNLYYGKNGDALLLQSRDRLLLQDKKSRINIQYLQTFNGLSIFLIDAKTPYLTGGGSGIGMGMITSANTTAVSAISGMLINVALDMDGNYGLKNSIAQFNTGNLTAQLSSYTVRKNSTFDFVTSVSIPRFTYPFNDQWVVYRFAFKNNLQSLVIYEYGDEGVYTPIATVDTGFTLATLPSSVKVGISWSGNFPLSIKNVALHGLSV